MDDREPGRFGRPDHVARPAQVRTDLEEKDDQIARLRTELEEKDVEIDQLKEKVAELERQLKDTKRPYRMPPHSDMGPGGPGFGP
jgi:hypothetical protein